MEIGWRLKLRYVWPWKSVLGWAVAFPLAVAYATARFAWDGEHWNVSGAVIGAGFGLLIMAFLVLPGNLAKTGIRVGETEQPWLWSAVQDAAARTGSPAPDAIWVVGEPSIEARKTMRRRDLLIGLPLLSCLPRPELTSLIARELALLQQAPGMVAAAKKWGAAANLVASTEQLRTIEVPEELRQAIEKAFGGAQRKAGRAESQLRSVGPPITMIGDAAAIAAVGSADVAARALVAAEEVESRFDELREEATPRNGWFQRCVEDLYDEWQRRLVRGWPDDESAEEDSAGSLAGLAAAHPTLASAIRGLEGAPVRLTPVSPSPWPLSEAQQHLLVRGLRGIERYQYVHWCTFAEARERGWLKEPA